MIPLPLRFTLLLAALWLLSPAVWAESGLELGYPVEFGTIEAGTYDERANRLGAAHLVVEKLGNGNVRLLSDSGFDGGARTVAIAELAPIEDGKTLRVLRQESRSFDPAGASMGVLAIDHRAGRATCTPPTGNEADTLTLELPPGDRVVNVPMTLLFQPLIRGETGEVNFQLLLCLGGPRLMDFTAKVARNGHRRVNGSPQLLEVRYRPDLGAVFSFFAEAVVPKLSFWFDPKSASPWVAHRLPLYSKGPEVFVVREGVPLIWLATGG